MWKIDVNDVKFNVYVYFSVLHWNCDFFRQFLKDLLFASNTIRIHVVFSAIIFFIQLHYLQIIGDHHLHNCVRSKCEYNRVQI
jgi:hypothetical protein